MLKDKLTSIKQSILKYNTYFTQAFDDVYSDDKGIRNDEKVLFPSDKLGDYFYLRLKDGVRYAKGQPVSDCDMAIEAQMSGYLIAFVKGANADDLVLNLVSTLMQINVIPTGSLWNAEEVVRQEMGKMKDKDVLAALARVKKEYTIVSVSFDYKGGVYPTKLNCITNPCACS